MFRQTLSNDWLDQLPLDKITSCQPVPGGDINLAYQLVAGGQRYFIKVQPDHPAKYFEHELNGLTYLGKAVQVPTPIAHGQINGDAYLILNWVDEGTGSQSELGKAVAHLHQQTADQFGFVDNHQTKVLEKDNSWNNSWVDFYVHQRLEPEIKAALAQGVWNDWRQAHFVKMKAAFEHYYAHHQVQPSLLHGDLWAGNFMFNQTGQPVLIDPDAVYGDREFDLAMTTIFGGFDESFYAAYNSAYPLESGVNDRLPWYQFYYLCMHLILFGESYGGAVDRILSQYE